MMLLVLMMVVVMVVVVMLMLLLLFFMIGLLLWVRRTMKLQQHGIRINIDAPNRHHCGINVGFDGSLILMMMMLLLLLLLLLTYGEVMKEKIKLSLCIVNLTLEFENDAVTSTNRVIGSNIRLEDDGAHSLVLVSLGCKVLNDLGDFSDTKKLVGVEELTLAIVREVRSENAVRGALPTLVFACSACRGGAVANPRDVVVVVLGAATTIAIAIAVAVAVGMANAIGIGNGVYGDRNRRCIVAHHREEINRLLLRCRWVCAQKTNGKKNRDEEKWEETMDT
ncbi:hypothetical protein LINGRAHAP2_LOCUS14369 [Linum grandiflorum]